MFIVGDARIHAVPELLLLEPFAVYPEAGQDTLEPLAHRLAPEFFDSASNQFVSAIRSWVIQLPGLTVVVDTGAGNGRHRPASPRFDRLDTPFLDRLAAVGVQPDKVDLVVCTHLHVDHVGWNTIASGAGWRPTFPNARYVLPRVEVAYWQTGPGAARAEADRRRPFDDSVAPLFGVAETMLADGEEVLGPDLRLVPLPGHSPGMMGLAVDRMGQRALFIADALHNPLQVWRPDLSSRYCANPAMATATRRRMLDAAAADGTVLLAAHVGGSGGLRIGRDQAGFSFTPYPDADPG